MNAPFAYVDDSAAFWYTAITSLPSSTGPKFVPAMVTSFPPVVPSVLNNARPLRPLIAGAVYDVVSVDACVDCCSPTVTFQR